jgi:hypothetical protein
VCVCVFENGSPTTTIRYMTRPDEKRLLRSDSFDRCERVPGTPGNVSTRSRWSASTMEGYGPYFGALNIFSTRVTVEIHIVERIVSAAKQVFTRSPIRWTLVNMVRFQRVRNDFDHSTGMETNRGRYDLRQQCRYLVNYGVATTECSPHGRFEDSSQQLDQ